MTLDEIVERLALPRTTVWYWIANIPIPRKPNTTWPERAQVKGNLAMQRKYRLLREAAYEEWRRASGGRVMWSRSATLSRQSSSLLPGG